MLTDRQLLVKAAAGSQDAFTLLYLRYSKRLYAYFLVRLDGNQADAEDMKQQVFLRLIESQAFQQANTGPDDISSLLFTIAANLLKNQYRSQERQGRREQIYLSIHQNGSDDKEISVDRQRLALAIQQLPAAQQLCIELRFSKGLSIDEIAAALDCAQGTVKSRLHYGLKKLAKILNATSIK